MQNVKKKKRKKNNHNFIYSLAQISQAQMSDDLNDSLSYTRALLARASGGK